MQFFYLFRQSHNNCVASNARLQEKEKREIMISNRNASLNETS